MTWIVDGETGLSVRTKLNTIPNDGTTATGFTVSSGNWTATPPAAGANISVVAANAVTTGAGGSVNITSGNAVGAGFDDAGDINVLTGTSVSGYSGEVNVNTANIPAADGGSGHIRFTTGGADFPGGIRLEVGSSGAGRTPGQLVLAGGSSTNRGGDVSISSGAGDVHGGDINIQAGTGADAASHGNIFMIGLPTSDPGETGALYVVAGVLKVSP